MATETPVGESPTSAAAAHEIATGLIEIDDEAGGSGSGTGPGPNTASDTTSLRSSLQEWLMENGRRYHAYYGPEKNMMPTDEVFTTLPVSGPKRCAVPIEQERLDMHHETMLLVTNGLLYKAPLEKPQKVLDIGTGTGIWAIDFAYEHPEAEVMGLDLSPIQPNWVPPNCRFEVDDFELEWTYPRDTFDYIHGRNIGHSVKKWPFLLAEVMSHLKPGGWFELTEIGSQVFSDDDSVPADWPPNRLFDLFNEGIESLGRKSPDGEILEKLLLDAGFVDVEVKVFKQPMTPWPKKKDLKQAGALVALQTENGYHAYNMAILTRILGWTTEDADALCKAAHEAHYARKSGVHAYLKLFFVYGRKPL